MARLKVLLFALVVLGAWVAHLYLLSPRLSARAVEQAEVHASAAPAALAVHLQQRRLEVQQTALALASNTHALAAMQPHGGKVEAPSAEMLAAVKSALGEAVPAELKSSLVLGLENEAGTIAARGDEAPAAADAVDVAALSGAGSEGLSHAAFGETHLFYSVPVTAADKGEAKVVGHIVVGAPLLSRGVVEAVAKETGMGAIGLLEGGKVVQAAGPQKALVEKASAKIAAGKSDVLERGMVDALGPVKLPMMTHQDSLGGAAPLWVSARQPVSSTPFEVVTVASVGAFMSSLAEYQKLALFAFGGIFLLSLVLVLVSGGGKAKAHDEADEGEAQSARAAAVPPPLPEQPAEEAASASGEADDSTQLLPPPVPQAAADDFPFGAAPESAQPPAPPAYDDQLFAPPPPPELPPEAPTRNAPIDPVAAFAQSDSEATMAYPTGADPFELAARQEAQNGEGGDFNPEATRVASVPQELIQASARPSHEPASSMRIAAPFASMPPPAAANSDESHYQDVFRDFLRTREQCGEPPDGLTFDRFAQKLRKNKEQLVAKYSCRTVRFQVYVKEGKAALKATPIKD